MQEIKIQATEDLIKELNNLPNSYFYRGHADARWDLDGLARSIRMYLQVTSCDD